MRIRREGLVKEEEYRRDSINTAWLKMFPDGKNASAPHAVSNPRPPCCNALGRAIAGERHSFRYPAPSSSLSGECGGQIVALENAAHPLVLLAEEHTRDDTEVLAR